MSIAGKSCGDPGVIINGGFTPLDPSNSYATNYSIAYACNYGYNLTSGSKIRMCEENELWSGTEPICSGEQCLKYVNFKMFEVVFAQRVTYLIPHRITTFFLWYSVFS